MFKIARRAVDDVEPFIHNLPITASESYSLGEALVLSSGKLTKCGATAKPTHICMGPVNENGCLPVIAVVPTTYFEVPATATVAATLIGSAVTLHTDGLQVTATTASGVFTIDETDGDKLVVGHFA